MRSDAITKSAIMAILEAFMASLTAPEVRLFTDNITPSPDTNLLTLNQPTGSWYTPQPLSYGDAFTNPDGSVSVVAQSMQFDYDGTDPGETVYGYMVVDPGSPDVPISAARLETPVNMGNDTNSVIVQPRMSLPPVPQSYV